MTTEQIQTAMLDSIARRDELVTEYAAKNRAAADAECALKLAHAKAVLQKGGSNAEERKANADLAVDAEMFKAKLLTAEAEGLLQAIRSKADEISAYQSLLRLERMEAEAIHYRQRNGA